MSDELDELRAYCARLESNLADLGLTIQEMQAEFVANAVPVVGPPVPPTFAEVEAWVSDTFSRLWARPITNTHRWCSQWFQHEEAVERLTALYVAWNEARQTGRKLAWWRDADATMQALTDAAGTFAACSERGHHPPQRLPCDLPGAEFYEGER